MIISTHLDYEIEAEQKGIDIEIYFNRKLWGTLGNTKLSELNHQKLRSWIISSFNENDFFHENSQPFFILDIEESELDLK